MPVVTGLRAARGGNVALHVDGRFVCVLSQALVAGHALYDGRVLDEEEVAAVREAASAERVLADAHRLLGHRARSREELRRRLRAKGHGEQSAAKALARLEADGLLDDAAFARSYVADKRNLSGWGERRLRRGLAELGVDEAVVDDVLAEASAGCAADDELARATALLYHRGAPLAPLPAARRRAYQMLVRRGFASAVAYAAVRHWSGAAPDGEPGDQGSVRRRAGPD